MKLKSTLKTGLAAVVILGAALAVAVAVPVLPALAGTSIPASNSVVRVSAGAWADGVVRTTRNSPDSTAYITCTVYSYATFDQARCSARDPEGDYVTCMTQEPRMIAAIRSVQPESRLYFQANGGACYMIEVHMDSARLP